MVMPNELLTEIIKNKKLMGDMQWNGMQKQIAHTGQPIFSYIMQQKIIPSEMLQQSCAEYFKLNSVDLDQKNNDALFLKIPQALLQDYFLWPIQKKNNTWIFAIANPDLILLQKKLSFQLGFSVEMQMARYDQLCQLHNAHITNTTYASPKDAKLLLQTILSDAMHRNASDIHIEAQQHQFRVRFRIDGLLHIIGEFTQIEMDAMVSCVKVLAKMDIAIKRTPQDGRFTAFSYLQFTKECRASSCPTIHGEKIVIRLLDQHAKTKKMDQLGLDKIGQHCLIKSVAAPQGLILITGPTGSGKSITLYTLLQQLNQTHRNIVTIEEPVEIQIDGINQIPVAAKTSFRFADALRAILRQDPDVIMVGEIRDQETAEMAVRAAQTGHLVLSTLHTNHAALAITRLTQMGIAPFYLSSALTLVIAQRLVRTLCSYCKKISIMPSEIAHHHYEASECEHCHGGFSGRTGVFEIMPITNVMRKMIADNAPTADLNHENKKNGWDNLWENGIKKVIAGTTSLSEIYRTVSRYDAHL